MAKKLTEFIAIIKRRRIALTILVLAVGGASLAATLWGRGAAASDYITSKIERGVIEVSVSATGTVQAVTTVQVGSQVSGTVSWLGADFNSRVTRGQIIARLDPAIFQAQVQNQQASLINAQSSVQAATTDINNQKANLTAAKANQEVARVQRDDAFALANRYKNLKDVISGRDLEAAQAQANAAAARYEQATAQIGQAQAAVDASWAKLEQAKAAVEQAKAQLDQARVNLDHAIISSPIDGVVVSRNVDVGQTVAASLQAPTLFTIANDLTSMQVLASIDEADVGQIRNGLSASFTVDAYPGESFSGHISQIRLNAQTQQNVVTYTAVIEVSNPDQKLLPGMTANITVPVARRDNALMVPNAALRFKPTLSQQQQQELRETMQARREQRQSQNEQDKGQPDQQQDRQRGERQRGEQQPSPDQAAPSTERPADASDDAQPRQTIWILTGGKKIEPRFIKTGITNGRTTEITGGDIHEGDIVVIGQNDASGNNNTQQSGAPFGQRGGFGPRR